jgi:pSer/pThr/pTyr-binding forkhead associated (FHA) protein
MDIDMYKNDNEIREYINQIKGLCDKVLESLEDKDDCNIGNIESEPKYPYLIRRKNGEKILVSKDDFKIGKDSTYVDYCILDNATISRHHADIFKGADGYYVKDTGSLNHTFLNGAKLEKEMPNKLENGNLIQFANEVFEWHCD